MQSVTSGSHASRCVFLQGSMGHVTQQKPQTAGKNTIYSKNNYQQYYSSELVLCQTEEEEKNCSRPLNRAVLGHQSIMM